MIVMAKPDERRETSAEFEDPEGRFSVLAIFVHAG
jgi:hypothetical protein